MSYNKLSYQQQTTLFKLLSSLSPAQQKKLEVWVSKFSAEELETLKELFEKITSSKKWGEIEALLPRLTELSEQGLEALISELSAGKFAVFKELFEEITSSKKWTKIEALLPKLTELSEQGAGDGIAITPPRTNLLPPSFSSEDAYTLRNTDVENQKPILTTPSKKYTTVLSSEKKSDKSVVSAWPQRFRKLPLEASSKKKLEEALQPHSEKERQALLGFFDHADERHQTAFLKALAAQPKEKIEKILPWFIVKHEQSDDAEIIKNFIQDPKKNSLEGLKRELINRIGWWAAFWLRHEFFKQLKNIPK